MYIMREEIECHLCHLASTL